MSWLDDLISQIAQNGSDAVPSDPQVDPVFNAAQDSSSASSLFSALFGQDSADSPSPDAPSYTTAAADSQRANDLLGLGPVTGATNAAIPQTAGALQGVLRSIGIKQDAGGNIDWSNPQTLNALAKLVIGGSQIMGALSNSKTPQGYKTAAQLRAEIQGPLNNWTPTQQASADRFFNGAPLGSNRQRIYAADMVNPIVAGKGYAMGGPVGGMRMGALAGMTNRPAPQQGARHFASGGALGYVMANGGGQDDDVNARLSGGEYVLDADSVAALGDGNNAAGAQRLDQMRHNLRTHKRSAPPDKIPPKAKPVEHYMKGKN